MALHLRAEEKGTSAVAARATDGTAAPMASLVLLRALLLATMRATLARAPASSPSSDRMASSSSWLAVSVPVLSTQSMSTWLSDSTALACWTSAPTRDMRTAASA